MTRRPIAALLIALAMAPPPAFAQAPRVPDAMVAAMMSAVLDSLGDLLCGPARKCEPATLEERLAPPVSPETARASIGQGIASAAAEACGVNWVARSFRPFMDARRAEGFDERQVAIVGALHGTGMAVAKAQIAENPPSEEDCARITGDGQ